MLTEIFVRILTASTVLLACSSTQTQAATLRAREPLVKSAAPLSADVPDGGYGGLGYANTGFGKGYARDATSPIEAVRALIARIGLDPKDFALGSLAADGLDTMQLAGDSGTGKVVVKGSSGVALASCLNWYLNEWCNTTYDWNTYNLTVPTPLPLPPAEGTEVRSRTVQWGYYMNVCTMGYSLVFNTWDYWEKLMGC